MGSSSLHVNPSIGKIKSKFLIFDIIRYNLTYLSQITSHLWNTSRAYRTLLIKNHDFLRSIFANTLTKKKKVL